MIKTKKNKPNPDRGKLMAKFKVENNMRKQGDKVAVKHTNYNVATPCAQHTYLDIVATCEKE